MTKQRTKIYTSVQSGIKDIYHSTILGLEKQFDFQTYHSPPLSDAEIDHKPIVLLLGQYSTGKSSFIQSLLGGASGDGQAREGDLPSYEGCHIGPEPTTDRFIAVLGGPESRSLPGNAAVASPSLPFSSLSEFGGGFLSKFQVAYHPSPLLDRFTLIDTPGVLSGEKQRLGRSYDFPKVCSWFAEKADLIILLFDAHKLDISDEFKRVLVSLKGYDEKIRVILNKADMISQQQLLRVYGALMWSLGKVVGTPEVVRVYIGCSVGPVPQEGSKPKQEAVGYDGEEPRQVREEEQEDSSGEKTRATLAPFESESVPGNSASLVRDEDAASDPLFQQLLARMKPPACQNQSLILAEMRDLLTELYWLPRSSIIRKMNDLVKRIKNLRVHCYLLSALRAEMPALFGKTSKQSHLIEHLPEVFTRVQRETHFPPGDFPDIHAFREKLSEDGVNFHHFPKINPKHMRALEHALSEDLPKLLADFPQGSLLTSTTKNSNPFVAESEVTEGRWSFNETEIKSYQQLFVAHCDAESKSLVSGSEVKKILLLEKSLPSKEVLGRIWKWADVDGDGSLSKEEFLCFMKLLTEKVKGRALDSELSQGWPEALAVEIKKVAASF